MKRLLFIPLDYHKPNVQLYLFDALKTQFEVTYYKGDVHGKPEIIYVQSGAISPKELIKIKRKTKATVIQWTGDCRPELLSEVMAYKGIVDKTFLACGIGQKEMYEQALGHEVVWLQHAGTMFVEPTDMQEGGIAFVGNYYDQFPGGAERNKLCYELDKKYEDEFFCYGSWGDSRGSVPYDDTPWIYANAYVSISANIFNDVEGYWSNRPYDILAAGSCCLMRYVPGIERHFTDGVHCVYYRSNEEAMEKIEWLLANPEIRNRIARAGFNHVRENHTWVNRAMELWACL